MLGRNRRVRLLSFGALVFFIFVIFSRNSGGSIESTQDYFGDNELTKAALGTVGGGSVLRPSLAEIPPQKDDVAIPDRGSEKSVESEKAETVYADPPDDEERSVEKASSDETKKESTSTDSKSAKEDEETFRKEPQVPLNSLPNKATPQGEVGKDTKADLETGEGEGRMEPDGNEDPTWTPPILHWKKREEMFPIKTTIPLPSGTSKPFPKLQRAEKALKENGVDKQRLSIVKALAKHTWDGYRKNAFGADEIMPLSGEKKNPFNGWGATLVDSLDTLWIMGMKDEFAEAVDKVAEIDFTTSKRSDIPLFETTIRYMGGLLGAYDVSGRDKKFSTLLEKATQLGEILYSAFDTPNRMPQTYYRWAPSKSTSVHRAGTRVVMAELGSLSMEFTRLAQITKEPKYYDAIARITDALETFQNETRLPGMWPTQLDASGCGSASDSDPGFPEPRKSMDVPDGSGWQMVAGNPVTGGKSSASSRGTTRSENVEPAGDLGSTKKRRSEDFPSQLEDGCVPKGLTTSNYMSQETFTLSGMSDSTYEYLPKTYLLLGGLAEQYKSMYLDSMDTVIKYLIYKPMTVDERNDILMSGELRLRWNSTAMSDGDMDNLYTHSFNPEVAHLACFAGGMFAMGGVIFDKPEHVDIGAKLTEGCVWAYNSTASGIMPEGGTLLQCPDTWGPCPWDETAWFNELDPYASLRDDGNPATSATVAQAIAEIAAKLTGKTSARPITTPKSAKALLKTKTEKKSGPGELADGIGRKVESMAKWQAKTEKDAEVEAKLDTRENDDESKLLRKRQLEKFLDDAPVALKTPSELAADAIGSNPSSHNRPFDTETQADFLARKIAQERLPPGFVRIGGKAYILRPEAIESVFYLYRITGDVHWREVGWNMFTAIERHTRADYGAAALHDITQTEPGQSDSQESFWLAETLKYFYLLYDEPSNWSLDDWVLNTEAHFFKRPEFEFVEAKASKAS